MPLSKNGLSLKPLLYHLIVCCAPANLSHLSLALIKGDIFFSFSSGTEHLTFLFYSGGNK